MMTIEQALAYFVATAESPTDAEAYAALAREIFGNMASISASLMSISISLDRIANRPLGVKVLS